MNATAAYLTHEQPPSGTPGALSKSQSNPFGPMLFGVLLILATFGGLGGWAALAPLESAVVATGNVVVRSERKVIQHLEGGIVGQIFVDDGDLVVEGQPLIMLDDIRTRAVYEIIKGQWEAALATEARLLAERDNAERVDFPEELLADLDAETASVIASSTRIAAADVLAQIDVALLPDEPVLSEAPVPMESTASAMTSSTRTAVATANVNVRSGPGTQYQRLALLELGAEVTIIGPDRDDDWLNCELASGEAGYLHRDFIQFVELDEVVTQTDVAPLAEMPMPSETPVAVSSTANKAITGQIKLFEARRRSLQGQVDILNKRIEQYREEIAGLEAQEAARQHQIALYEQELEGLRTLAEQGNIPVHYVLDKERILAQLQGEHGKFRSDAARARQGIAETQLQITQLRKDRHEEVATQLREIEARVADQEQRLVAAKDSLERMRIRAPAPGMVFGLAVHTPNAVIKPGQIILSIVPLDDELIVDARAQITDIDNIAVDQEASIRFTALSARDTPIIGGRVIYVSPDSQADEYTGAPYYAVKIRVPPEELARLGDIQLQPGMPAETLIKTGNQTALEYLIKPFHDILAKAFLEE